MGAWGKVYQLAVQVQCFGDVPLMWVELSKAGNSNSAERIALLDKLFEAIPSLEIASLTADREFIGKHWIHYLMKKSIQFFIRVKQNRLVDWGNQPVQAGAFFNHLRVGDPPRKIYYSVFQYGLNHLRCIADDVLRWILGAKLRRNYSIHSMDYALVAKK